MCGINGIVNYDKKPVDRELLILMRDALLHRGPDDAGIWIEDNVGLGHRRLSIIDLSEAGHQPMTNEDETIWLVFNGEIYNYLELKAELKQKGHIFKSQTDSEVIVHAYEEFKEDCVKIFNGMWAFVIWDKKENKLFASRDRFGEKPFYYYNDKDSFYFSSEIKAFFKTPTFRKRMNPKIVFLYLVYNYTDTEEETFYEGIKQLLPGYNLILKSRQLSTYKYWDLDCHKSIRYKNETDYIFTFRDIFKDAVKIRLRSDVEIGTSLSGGIDSSSITSMVKYIDERDKRMLSQKNYSAIFPGSRDNEYKWIEIISQKLNIHSLFVSPDGKDLIENLTKLILHQEEPFFSPNVYLQWEIMKLAKENRTVVLLDGQGSDELLAGYPSYFSIFWRGMLGDFKLWTLAKEFSQYILKHKFSPQAFLNKSLFNEQILEIILKKRYGYLRRDFLNNHFKQKYLDYDKPKFNSLLKDALYLSCFKGSLPYLLRYADRNSMAFGREIRLPFLDYRLVEFLFAIPDDFIIRGGTTKYILRKALETIVPQEILNREDKIGYAYPLEGWFNLGMQEIIEKRISEVNNDHPFFISSRLKEYWRLYLKGNKSYLHTREIWKIFNLLIWIDIIFESRHIT